VLTVRRSGLLTVLLSIWLLTWHFRECLLVVVISLTAPPGPDLGSVVSWVGGVSITVYTVGVDL
jgi:hypothetical protein